MQLVIILQYDDKYELWDQFVCYWKQFQYIITTHKLAQMTFANYQK